MANPIAAPSPAVQTTSAPKTPALTQEQRKARYAELRAKMGRSLLYVKPPAGKTGYFARKDDTNELYRLQAIGFSIVHDDPQAPVWEAGGRQLDGTYIVGDVILLEIDTELYEMHLQDNSDKSDAMIDGGKTGFLERAKEQGIPAFETTKTKG